MSQAFSVKDPVGQEIAKRIVALLTSGEARFEGVNVRRWDGLRYTDYSIIAKLPGGVELNLSLKEPQEAEND